ncbi:alkaline phosphatase [Aequorivita echinoideorum]|uniref:Alkaline phosphatase n=1 Tax=Aequorivita echinoideorum TaxID=1549647 RepID=A0ABS5S2P3_9FLAO|nr:alkaline phosphatase [Aequorivita echinoideorum]MBT0607477.1 alkaline phosphatase [Aequorivita echinoideorum]
MQFKSLFALLSISYVLSSCISVNVKDNKVSSNFSETKKPKNIILLIGDGMGLSQVSAAIYYKNGKPNFERFTTIGLSKTSSSSDLVTDSAAGATVFSAGVKTYNGAIGVDNDTIPVETIVEKLSKEGFATGIISTSSIVHATPASFYAHVKRRSYYEEIATFAPNSGVDFFAGGGIKFFEKRKDGRNLLNEMKEKGYSVFTENLPTKPSLGKEIILMAEDGMPKMSEGRGNFLTDATKLALEKLSKNENGFFLMVEGSQIDWGGHANDADYLIEELLDFDKTIGAALDFAEENGETLVLVTADHETGGFTLAADGSDYNKLKSTFSTPGHSGTMVPVFARGPGENYFNGIYENTAIYHKMKMLLDK